MVHRNSTPETNNKEPPDYEPSSTVSEAGKDSKSDPESDFNAMDDEPKSKTNAQPQEETDHHYIFLLDDSLSMKTKDRWRSPTRWVLAKTALADIVDSAIPDGIDIHFLNEHGRMATGVKTKEEVEIATMEKELKGFTPLGRRVSDLLIKDYIPMYEAELANGVVIKPLYLIVITDGCPNKSQDTYTLNIFKTIADRLDAHPSQVGIQLIQIGNDEDATAFLKTLDDNLKDGCNRRDIVDTVPYEAGTYFDEDYLFKVLKGAVSPEVDASEVTKKMMKKKKKKKGLVRHVFGF